MSASPRSARRMPGTPRTEDGHDMPLAAWYRLLPASGSVEYVAITNHGVYQVDPFGQVHDFFQCLYQRPAIGSHADALRHVGGGYELAEAVAR